MTLMRNEAVSSIFFREALYETALEPSKLPGANERSAGVGLAFVKLFHRRPNGSGGRLVEDIPDTHTLSDEEKQGVWKRIFEAAEDSISALRRGPADDIYHSINSMIDSMRKRGASETTIFGHKTKLVKLFRYLKLEM